MFSQYNFKDYINKGLNSLGFTSPTSIQKQIIPLALNKTNVIGKSQTGTGKTHSFILPILQMIDEKLQEVQATIIVPTRELALQIFDDFNNIIKFCEDKIDLRMYVGGTNRITEIERLKKLLPSFVSFATILWIGTCISENCVLTSRSRLERAFAQMRSETS